MGIIDHEEETAASALVHRYPTDGKLDSWHSSLGILPGLFATTLNILHTDLSRVRSRVTEAADDRVRG